MKAETLSRRSFLGGTAATAFGFLFVPSHVLGREGQQPPSNKLNVACIGCGGKGGGDVGGVGGENVVALCDVDWNRAKRSVKRHPKAKQFTDYPHLTIGVSWDGPTATVTVPNGVKGGFRTKLNTIGLEGFRSMLAELETALQPIMNRSVDAKPVIYAVQRHYKTQRSLAEVDGRIDADLRTVIESGPNGVKYQPQWVDAIYSLLCNKRSNIQFGVQVRFPYNCPIVRSRQALDLMAGVWKALWPLIDFVLGD